MRRSSRSGGAALWSHRAELEQEAHSWDLVLLGVGLFLAGFAGAIVSSRDRAGSLVIDRTAARLVVTDGGGAEVVLPAGALVRAGQWLGAGAGDLRVVVVHQRDGGVIELGALRDEDEAEALVSAVEAVIVTERRARQAGAAEDTSVADGLPADPLGRFQQVAGVRAERVGDELRLGWRARMSPAGFAVMGCLAGVFLVGYAAWRAGGGGGAIAMASSTLLSLLLLAVGLYSLGLRQHVVIDSRQLTFARYWFGKLSQRRRVPSGSVVAIDHSHLAGPCRRAPSGRVPLPERIHEPKGVLHAGIDRHPAVGGAGE